MLYVSGRVPILQFIRRQYLKRQHLVAAIQADHESSVNGTAILWQHEQLTVPEAQIEVLHMQTAGQEAYVT